MTTTTRPRADELIHRLVADLARATGTNESTIRFRYGVEDVVHNPAMPSCLPQREFWRSVFEEQHRAA